MRKERSTGALLWCSNSSETRDHSRALLKRLKSHYEINEEGVTKSFARG